jgi:endonuclease YncB( thermonuclease family)
VGRPWKPDDNIVRGPWGSPDAYVRQTRRSRPAGALAGAVLAGAACLGIAYGYFQPAVPRTAPADAPAIEWDAVQAVPRRAPDAEDVEWQQRAAEADGAGSPRAAARPEAVRASFSYCHSRGGTNCVVDGDTFWIGGEKVRIAGIDAPETHPPRCADEARLGNAATERLHALLNSGAVTMTSIDRDRDRYGRLLRNVAVNGADIGEAMIGAGVARAYGSGRRSWC